MRIPRLSRASGDSEQGMAIATSMLIMMLCAIVVAGVLQLATHSAQRSGQNRDRTAALNAAQAGIQAELSLISDGSCPTAQVGPTALPNQTTPTASYIIQAPPAATCTVNGSAVIVATGYVPDATNPTSTTTMVAHVNRTQGAPLSAGTNGGYDFPDAIFTDGTLCTVTSCGAAANSAISLFGSGGAIPNVTANGAVTIGNATASGSQLGGAVYGGQGGVTVFASQIGGPVTGTTVNLTGPANGMTVQGGITATTSLSLTNATVNGVAATPGGVYSHTGTVTVTGGTTSGPVLPQARPLGVFNNSSQSDIGTTLGVGAAATAACPASATAWTSGFYDIASTCAVGYAPGTFSTTAANGSMVIVVQGPFTVNIPQTAVGGQLYIIDAGGAGDSLTIIGSGSTLPVFAFTDGSLNLSGTLVGQLAAHSINVAGATTMTFTPPVTPMPDISFPVGYFAPNLGSVYYSRVAFEYQCSGATAC